MICLWHPMGTIRHCRVKDTRVAEVCMRRESRHSRRHCILALLSPALWHFLWCAPISHVCSFQITKSVTKQDWTYRILKSIFKSLVKKEKEGRVERNHLSVWFLHYMFLHVFLHVLWGLFLFLSYIFQMKFWCFFCVIFFFFFFLFFP